jgi:hypothetical protein
VAVAPGVGVDVDLVAVLSKAVDEGDDAGGAGEDGAPLLEGQVGGDDRGSMFVAAADDVEEDVGRAAVAGQVAEFVKDQERRPGVPLEPALEGGKRLLLEEIGEGGGQRGEANGLAGGSWSSSSAILAFALTDPSVRLSRTRLFPRVTEVMRREPAEGR